MLTKITDRAVWQAIGGKNKKDMASYKFWQTQPVPKFGMPHTLHCGYCPDMPG